MAASIDHYQLPLPTFQSAVRLLIVVSPYYREIADDLGIVAARCGTGSRSTAPARRPLLTGH